MTRTLVNEISAFIEAYQNEENDKQEVNNLFSLFLDLNIELVVNEKLSDQNKERSIDVIITRLRKKIEIDQKSPKFLQTIRGAGYVLWIE